jgi:hypothetical protein
LPKGLTTMKVLDILIFVMFLFQPQSVEKPRSVAVANSSLKVHVYKTGLFSAFGHNHEIEAPIESGEVSESGKLSVTLRVDARKLKVLDPCPALRDHSGLTFAR